MGLSNVSCSLSPALPLALTHWGTLDPGCSLVSSPVFAPSPFAPGWTACAWFIATARWGCWGTQWTSPRAPLTAFSSCGTASHQCRLCQFWVHPSFPACHQAVAGPCHSLEKLLYYKLHCSVDSVGATRLHLQCLVTLPSRTRFLMAKLSGLYRIF